MSIRDIAAFLETIAPTALQEDYDNSGLLAGNPSWSCTGMLCSLDLTMEVLLEARQEGCNLVVCHHPFIFKGLKSVTGRNWIEEALIYAIKQDIAIYAIHTNLDNVLAGVSGKMAQMLGLQNCTPLQPLSGHLRKLVVFVPRNEAERVRGAIFSAGGGAIGKYAECSFNQEGEGTFKAGPGTDPYVGERGIRHTEPEIRIEAIYESYKEKALLQAMLAAHPYEEVAYDLVPLANSHPSQGAGVLGKLPEPISLESFLDSLSGIFGAQGIRHNGAGSDRIETVALCGGAGGFLAATARSRGADVYVTADLKYHDFFENRPMTLVDLGHYESEQFTIALLHELLREKFPNFAVLKTKVNTNPVHYFRPAAQVSGS